MKRALLAMTALITLMGTVGCCCRPCDPCQTCRPCRPFMSLFFRGGCNGCGPRFWGDYFEGRDCCDPCDGCGNWTGGCCDGPSGGFGWSGGSASHGGCTACGDGGMHGDTVIHGDMVGRATPYDDGEVIEMGTRILPQSENSAPRMSTRSSNSARMATMRRTSSYQR